MTLIVRGRLDDLRGRRTVFSAGLIVFLAASLMVLQTLSIIAAALPAEKRGAARGAWSAVYGLAMALGPILSGTIVDAASWRWLFRATIPAPRLPRPAVEGGPRVAWPGRQRVRLPARRHPGLEGAPAAPRRCAAARCWTPQFGTRILRRPK
jgi:MFS family permease